MSRYRLNEIEEVLAELDTDYIPDDIAETDEEYQLVVSGIKIYVESLNLYLREGIFCNFDEEENMYMPDFAVTVLYEADKGCEEWLYFEQDGFVTTMANFLSGKMPVEQIEQLWCELIIPENVENESEENV